MRPSCAFDPSAANSIREQPKSKRRAFIATKLCGGTIRALLAVLLGLSGIAVPLVQGQPRVLHFTRTSGYDHGTRGVSYDLFNSIGNELGLVVDDDASGDPFSEPSVLALYAVIIFSNTSGDAILTAAQRSNFEAWVAGGGHVLGIHAASDTYRHSAANGNNTGTWDYYAELIGASVQEAPNHVSGTPEYAMQHIGLHASTANLPDPWVKNEEYYYWEGGYFGPDNNEVLRVEQTLGPNGLVNSYDAPRAMSWYRELANGSRVFYTALGHAQSNYTSDLLFRTHLKDALAWMLDIATGLSGRERPSDLRVYVDPLSNSLQVWCAELKPGDPITVYDALGRPICMTKAVGPSTLVEWREHAPGNYVLLGAGRAVRFTLAP